MKSVYLKNFEKPRNKELTEDINWICDSLNLSSGRDTKATAKKIVKTLVKKFANKGKVTSLEVAKKLEISPGTVNHHVRRFIDTGLVYRKKKKIYLRGGSLKSAIEEIRRDTNRIFDKISAIAKDVDEELGLKNR